MKITRVKFCVGAAETQRHAVCPTIVVSCDNCGKKKHYARVCCSKSKEQADNRNQRYAQNHSRYNKYHKNPRNRQDSHGEEQQRQNTARRARHVGYQESDDMMSVYCVISKLITPAKTNNPLKRVLFK